MTVNEHSARNGGLSRCNAHALAGHSSCECPAEELNDTAGFIGRVLYGWVTASSLDDGLRQGPVKKNGLSKEIKR